MPIPADRYIVPSAQRGSVLGELELEALSAVVHSDLSLTAGAWRTAFESQFAELVGCRHALSVTSGTVALELAIGVLDLRPGDEVIATPQTYKATVQSLSSQHVSVRFCDVDRATLNADPASIESLVTERTKAILIVHYGGLPADMDSIMTIARRHGVRVIEDCAHALGSRYRGRRPGAFADIGCFSFHSSKNISTLGEGGMITLADDDWAERLERIRSNDADGVFVPSRRHLGGRTDAPKWMLHPGNSYTHDCVELRHGGTNATLSEAGAAVGIAQLGRLDKLVLRRRQISARITAVLRQFPFVRVVEEPADVVNSCHLYTFFVDPDSGCDRDWLVGQMEQQGIQMQLRYFPLHLLPEWRIRGHRPGECPVAEKMWFTQQAQGYEDMHAGKNIRSVVVFD